MTWRDDLRPASFRGVSFRVETTARSSGRRGQTLEFPKRDTPSDEDLGRRAKRFSVIGYVVGPDHNEQADTLERALLHEGPGQLITHLMGAQRVRCETYTRSERRQEGGVTGFDMIFVEAGTPVTTRVAEPTQANVQASAEKAEATAAAAADRSVAEAAPLPPPKPTPTPEVIAT